MKIRRRHMIVVAALIILGGWLYLWLTVRPPEQAELKEANPGSMTTGASMWRVFPESRTRLVAASANLDEQGQGWAGVLIELDPNWKTYWRDPGDAGLPTQLDWSRSTNLAAADLHWPVPQRFEFQNFSTIGYREEVLLPIKIRAADPKSPVVLNLNLDYAACDNVCIPRNAGHRLLIREASGTQRATGYAIMINGYRERLPVPADKGELSVTGTRLLPGEAILEIGIVADKPMVRPDILIDAGPNYRFSRADGRLAENRLSGVLRVEIDGPSPAALRSSELDAVLYDIGFRGVSLILRPGN